MRQDQADSPYLGSPNVFHFCVCFFPRRVLETKHFWEILISIPGGKWEEKGITKILRGWNYHHDYFTEALGDADTGPCRYSQQRQRFESQALWWWTASLPWLERWTTRSFRPGLSAALCQDAFSGLVQLPTFSSFSDSKPQSPGRISLFRSFHHCLLLVFSSQSQMHSGLQCIQFPASSLLLKTNICTFCVQSNFRQVQQGGRVGVAEIRNL